MKTPGTTNRAALCISGILFIAMAASLASAADPVPKVLIIGIDGLRPDAMMKANTPNLDGLIADGCLSLQGSTCEITVSGPGWSSMLTGVWPTKHEVASNDFLRPRYPDYPHFFTRLKQVRPELITASFDSWEPLPRLLVPVNDTDHGHYIDYEDNGDVLLTDIAADLIATQPVDCVFFYYADVDVAGHDSGFHPDNPAYIAEIEQVDGQLKGLLDAVKARATYDDENWLYIVSTDHGGTLDGAHGRDEPKHRKIPFIVSGASAARGTIYPHPNVVDVAVTALAHFGVEPDPAWALEGRAVGFPREIRYGENLIFNGDAEYAAPIDDPAVNNYVPGWIDEGGMSVLTYGVAEGYLLADTPGPADRGQRFFFGGGERDSRMSQTIGVHDLATDIDAGNVECQLFGWLGGFAGQADFATLTATFRDERGGDLGSIRIGPVTVNQRRTEIGGTESAALTGLLERRTSGAVPPGTRTIELVLEAEVGEGANDGYADNLSFELLRDD